MMEWDDGAVVPMAGGRGGSVCAGMRFSLHSNGHEGADRRFVMRFGPDVLKACGWQHKDRMRFRFSRARREMLIFRIPATDKRGYSLNQSKRKNGAMDTTGYISMAPDAIASVFPDIWPIVESLAKRNAEPTYTHTSDGLVVSLADGGGQ